MEFLNPAEILKEIKLEKDMTAADFGCGSGGWALPLAKILEDGHVFAIDILEEPLSALRSKAKLEKIANVDAIKADVEKGTSLLSDSCDLVLMTNLLFQVRTTPEHLTPDVSSLTSGVDSGVKRVLEEGKRVLKQGGEILLVDWKPESPLGPKQGRVSMEEVKNLAKDANLKLEQEFSAGNYHYALVFKK